MIVTLNGLRLNDAGSGYYIPADSITGLGIADIRWSSGLLAGANGGWSSGPYYGIRDVAVPLTVYGDDPASHEQRRSDLITALTNDDGKVTVQIVTDGGHAYVLYGRLMPFDMPLSGNPIKSSMTIELECDDPLIYDDGIGASFTAPLFKTKPGGVTFPLTFPLIFTPSTLPATIVNNGAVPIFPVITLSGSMTAPVIKNTTTGSVFSMSDLHTGDDDVLKIDMQRHTLMLNGDSAYQHRDLGSSWIYLMQGSNQLTLDTSSSGDTVTGVVEWRSGYLGV